MDIMRLIYSCQDIPPIWTSSVGVFKCSYSYLKQKQPQKEGASYALLAFQSAFLHKKSHNFRIRWIVHQGRNEVMSSAKADSFRGFCWQIANPMWNCNFLSLMNCHKAPEERGCPRPDHILVLLSESNSSTIWGKLQGLRNSAVAESIILFLPFAHVEQRKGKKETLGNKGGT